MSSISIIGVGSMASALAGRALAGGNDTVILRPHEAEPVASV
jgi:pyrroline-5-carboxylate reductase